MCPHEEALGLVHKSITSKKKALGFVTEPRHVMVD